VAKKDDAAFVLHGRSEFGVFLAIPLQIGPIVVEPVFLRLTALRHFFSAWLRRSRGGTGGSLLRGEPRSREDGNREERNDGEAARHDANRFSDRSRAFCISISRFRGGALV